MSQRVPATSSGILAASAAASISARPAMLLSVILNPAAAASVLIIYDNAAGAASGTVLCKLVCPASSVSVIWEGGIDGIPANQGLSYSLTGAGAEAIVYFCAE